MSFEVALVVTILVGLVVVAAVKDWIDSKAAAEHARDLIDRHALETRYLIDTIISKHIVVRNVAQSIEKQTQPTVQTLASANLMAQMDNVRPKDNGASELDLDGHLYG